jgi:hypothetical protein
MFGSISLFSGKFSAGRISRRLSSVTPPPFESYEFSSFIFTTRNKTGRTGPSLLGGADGNYGAGSVFVELL